ncbi:MAG: M20/M25/M40 family metallo-hydrolase [Verrucomicrobium sp.]|nr:M20/M25/M40 family metallo-hydrolase [Verrucomicrobium sp.]
MNPDELSAWLGQRLPDALSWLERMVGINSFSTNPAGVNILGRMTADCFRELGFEPEYVPSANPSYGAHLFLRRPGSPSPDVLLVSHLDTVFPPEEEDRENFRWQPAPAEGRIYGPGTVDIKGGTMLIWLVLGALKEFAPKIFEETGWLVALDASEEVLSADFARRTTERCPQGVKAVLVYEGGPREGDIQHLVTSRKGRAEYRISALGRAAHAGSSHADGVNAIVALAGVVQEVAEITDLNAGLTVNVGHIEGGTVTNRVPHEASAELEMRAFDPEVLTRAQAEIESMAHESDLAHRIAGIAVACHGVTPAWPNDERTQGLFEIWADVASVLGPRPLSVSRGGLSDANYLCHLGPTLDGLGPCGGNAHCSERSADGTKVPEYVETATFVPKAMMSVLGILKLIEREKAKASSVE